jgi:hypothetical protein
MSPVLDDPAMLENDDQVGVANRRKAMGDDEGGAACQEPPEGDLDSALRADVHTRRCLVEDQDARIGEQGACEGDELTLAQGQPRSALGHLRLVPVLEGGDELVRADSLRGCNDLRLRCVGAPERDVLADGPGEEEALLGNDSELAPKALLRYLAQIMAVDRDSPCGS